MALVNRAMQPLTAALERADSGSSIATVVRSVLVVVTIGLASALLRALDADLASAALALLAVVVVAASFGLAYGALATACGYLALNLWFTNPTGSIAVDKVEDLVPLVAFA